MQFRPFYCTQNQLNSSTESIAQAGRLIICTDSKSIYFCPSDGMATLVGKANDVTVSEAGLMTPGMFSKLNAIADNANAVTYSQTIPINTANSYEIGKINIDGSETIIYGRDNNTETKIRFNNTGNYNSGNIDVTKGSIGLGNVENKSSAEIRNDINSSNVTTALGFTPLNADQKGNESGVAPLDSNRKVPIEYLPSYVSDVFEYESKTAFPTTGESNKIYVAKDTNLTYRWSGSQYIEISPSLALGTTSNTAFPGDKGNTLYTTYGPGITKGSSNKPVYIANGEPTEIDYTIAKSVPEDAVFTDSHYESKNVVGSSKATSNTTSALTNGNVYLNSVENGSVTSAHKISGTGATTVTTDASGNIIINSTNTTYNSMTGATASTAGSSGLVPAPAIGNRGQFLKGDGTWATPTDTNTWNANALNVAGYVAAPTSSTANKVWKTDASGNPAWRDDADTRYSAGAGLSLSGNAFGLSESGVTAGVKGPTADVTGNNSVAIKIPQIKVDTYGRVTALNEFTYISVDTNTTYNPYTSIPAGNGAGSPGSSNLYARGDHVHPALEWETF